MKGKNLGTMIIVMLTFFVFIGISSCATSPSITTKFQNRRYNACTEKQIAKYIPEWKGELAFCFAYCSKWKLWRKHIKKNCKYWKTEILKGEDDLKKIRDGGFVLVNEAKIF